MKDGKRALSAEEENFQNRAKALFSALSMFALELVYSDVEELAKYQDRDIIHYSLQYFKSELFEMKSMKSISLSSKEQFVDLLDGLSDETDHYCLMLYNDEIHTYAQVELMLKHSINATEREAQGYANTVDKVGRTILKQSKQEECIRIQKIVSEKTSEETSFQREQRVKTKPIKTMIIDVRLVGMQEMAIGVLKWMKW